MFVVVEYKTKRVRKMFRSDELAAEYIDTMKHNPSVVRITSPGRPTDGDILGEVVWYQKARQ